MAKLVLHMGTHKTGTTTVQDCFHANRILLAEHGVIYPALGYHTGHHGVLTDWIALPQAYHLDRGGIGTLQALAAGYKDSDIMLVLSSEEFSRAGGAGGQVDMVALRSIFAGFDQIKVVCCLRPQWQFLQSVYLEIARDRRPPAPPEIVSGALSIGQIDGLWCDYGALYDHLRTGFEADEIKLLDFVEVQTHPDGIVGALLSELGVPLRISDLAHGINKRSNVSPRPLPIWVALALISGGIAQEGHLGSELVGALTTALDLEYGAGRPNSIFTRNEQAQLIAQFAPRNAQLAARIDGAAPMFLSRTPTSSTDTLYREDLSGHFWVRAARRIYMMHPRDN